MKKFPVFVFLAIVIFMVSCRKDQLPSGGNNTGTPPVRKVRYELYTKENFSGNEENIQFILFMRNTIKTIFDSTLATIKIKDIPDSAHRIVIEKMVPENDTSVLAVGFVYQIENVGISGWQEPFPVGDTIKVIRYSFR